MQVFCIALKDAPGCQEFLLQDDGKWVHVKETTEIGEGKLFAPGNLRATFDNPEYEKLVSFWLGEKYTLRYTGGMVPDVFQIIVKEKGARQTALSVSPYFVFCPVSRFSRRSCVRSARRCERRRRVQACSRT